MPDFSDKRPWDTRHTPAPIPGAGVFDEPRQKIVVNAEWMSHIVGVMERLLVPDAWAGTEAESRVAIDGMRAAIDTARTPEIEGAMFDLRMTDGTLEKTTDGVTWEAVTIIQTITGANAEAVGPDAIAEATIDGDGILQLKIPVGHDGADGGVGETGAIGPTYLWRVVEVGPGEHQLEAMLTASSSAPFDEWYPVITILDGDDGSNGTNGTDGQDGTCLDCPAPAPPMIVGQSTEQRACNIAAYLATYVIKVGLQAAYDAAVAAQGPIYALQQFIQGLDAIATIAGGGIGGLLLGVLSTMLADVQGGSTEVYEAALADDGLWSDVTCAIYSAIVADGDVTEANFDYVTGNITDLSYSPSFVQEVLAQFLIDAGFAAISNLIAGSVFTESDCTGCGVTEPETWCVTYEFQYGEWDWHVSSGNVAASWTEFGYHADDETSLDPKFWDILLDFPEPCQITEVRVTLAGDYSDGHTIAAYLYNTTLGASPTYTRMIADAGSNPVTPLVYSPWPALPADDIYRIMIVVSNQGHSPIDVGITPYVFSVQIEGTGPNPRPDRPC